MHLTVVVDNFCIRSGLFSEWGYSCWISTENGNVLLDTGGNLHILMENLNILKLPIQNLDTLVLSHSHYDHISGIEDVLNAVGNLNIYAGQGAFRIRRGDADQKRISGGIPEPIQNKVKLFEKVQEIHPHIFAFRVPVESRLSCFECRKNMWEVNDQGQIVPDLFSDDVSLVIEGKLGYSLLLGCAHAGLPNILNYAEKTFGIDEWYSVIGGTHLSGVETSDYPLWIEELAKHRVEKWRPNHCTGFKAAAMLYKNFNDVDWAGAGFEMDL